MNEPKVSDGDWHCGGWDGARRETQRFMQSLTFDQKLEWLEGAQQLVAEMHGWDVALLPSGSTIKPRWRRVND